MHFTSVYDLTTHTTVYGTPWYETLGAGRAGGNHRGTINGLMPSHHWPTLKLERYMKAKKKSVLATRSLLENTYFINACYMPIIEIILISRNGQQWKPLWKCLKPCYPLETNLYSPCFTLSVSSTRSFDWNLESINIWTNCLIFIW